MDEASAWGDLSGLPADPPLMRDKCVQCGRPSVVCWCPFLPTSTVSTCSRVIVLQHPAEEKRCLRTVPMLELSLEPHKCQVFRGKKFPQPKHNGLADILQSDNTLVLYPSKSAVLIDDLPVIQHGQPYNVVVIDGTWAQAKSIFFNSAPLHQLQQVKLDMASEYVIRTQPNEGCVSTLEAVAHALSVLEGRPGLRDELLRPLHALCTFQLTHGAVAHQSKELLLDLGEYRKPVGRRTRKKIQNHAFTSNKELS